MMNSLNDIKPVNWGVSYNTGSANARYITNHQGPIHPQVNYSSYYSENQNWMNHKRHDSIPPGYPTSMVETHSPGQTVLETSPQPMVKIEPSYSPSPMLTHQSTYSPSPAVQQISASMHPSPQLHPSPRQPFQLDPNSRITMFNNLVDCKRQVTLVLD
jgi:hypothetical protein